MNDGVLEENRWASARENVGGPTKDFEFSTLNIKLNKINGCWLCYEGIEWSDLHGNLLDRPVGERNLRAQAAPTRIVDDMVESGGARG